MPLLQRPPPERGLRTKVRWSVPRKLGERPPPPPPHAVPKGHRTKQKLLAKKTAVQNVSKKNRSVPREEVCRGSGRLKSTGPLGRGGRAGHVAFFEPKAAVLTPSVFG
ncbi:uncharacterized protein BDZ99DRAFT_470224 [Mytilinidion resinicola]|uniref:Uncharacterized protein n=1 Tax=Mytilinidion resinicola TaxID=574789 RepID=A0A6A6ZA77_9PEZI|nr:uncharacterized protein BDZ99DRAFT_470224 [Mytilinidion resinicola]KAF2817185.1 hypothetical protein BDZ99DRAFT_470224 [Mytilinidion resinicola]